MRAANVLAVVRGSAKCGEEAGVNGAGDDDEPQPAPARNPSKLSGHSHTTAT